MKYERYEPGNGNSYELVYGWAVQDDEPHFILTWFDNGGGGVSVRCQGPTAPHWTYIADKLGVCSVTAKALKPFMTEKMEAEL